jgi:primosomal protein N' (replication factor Y)
MAEELIGIGSRKTLFAEIVLPVPIPKFFTYRVPYHLNESVQVGQRVIVQFGDRKILTGVIANLHEKPPREYEAKYILELLDSYPVLEDIQLKLYQWIAQYYMCSVGEVLNAALPSGLKLSSESMVQLNPSFDLEESTHPFSENEIILLRRLQHESLGYSEITKLLGVKQLYSILKSLVSKEAIILFEEIKEKYKPKTEKFIRLHTAYETEGSLQEVFNQLSSKPKQESVLLAYLQHVPVATLPEKNKTGLAKNVLLNEGLSESSLQTLIKNNILEGFEVIVPRFQLEESAIPEVRLSTEQQRVQQDIFKSFDSHSITLLHGITGSGKTEIYLNLIKRALDSGTQVLYLLPEIAITTQIVQRLQKIFGNKMGVYHSKFSDNERVEVWNGILSGRFKFVVGVRSSVFLPFDNLGLIIVDEEHDQSYKQQEPSPRYHARDVAMMMGQMHHAKVLLGSATPSVESYHQARQGKYGLVSLATRYGEAQLPTVVLADMRMERKQKTVKGEFSGSLLKEIESALTAKEQVIIFQNRRGYSPMINCEDCGWVPKCVNCSVSLTYHQYRQSMICHYCGYKQPLPVQCPTCSSSRIKTVGYGTEKLGEELKIYFPDASVDRMDLDTTRSKSGYEQILENFERGETNILVGTQMVTKGLDFDHVSVVGIFNADRMMHFPDFRSYERAYQLITQVSGRAGRRDKPGKVIVQTSSPDHPLLQTILNHDYETFFKTEIEDRQLHLYPPFTRLIEIIVRNVDKKVCRHTADSLTRELRTILRDIKILGPTEPIVSKIRNQYLMNTLIKLPRGQINLQAVKENISETINRLSREKEHRKSRIIVDVDPV